jgi:hypothetical protein
MGSGSSVPSSGEVVNAPEGVSALFDDPGSAESAVRELLKVGVPAADISMITRDEDHRLGSETGSVGGVAREVLGEEGITYRLSPELPAHEDLPSTESQMTGSDLPLVTDFEVPPNEPLGGSVQLGLTRDEDLVRHVEAEPAADADIYTDFPAEPGGINPHSPAAHATQAGVVEEKQARNEGPGNAAAGAGIGGVVGLLAGAAALAIPGVGPFIAAGPLTALLGGALAGGAAGGIIGALSGIGVPDEYAREYAAGIEQGQTLVSVRPGELSREQIARLLAAHGAKSIH